ncbi:hypothetical protein OG555_24475 [Kribbella sp. NBC_01484]|uniref:hypothetical protein n=1 Tax=Kribbella sp. NBC_01484 TaxID=2903579 RepID=UPI002E343CDD|nr:hypothetical protein [Kribbella sp. NBC_01484]
MLMLATTAAALVGALPSAAKGVLLRNYRTQFLNAVPSADMPTSCTSQHVDLPAGEYGTARYWSEPTNNWDYAVFRTIRLAAGGYTWTDCLKPMTGYYIHTSELDPDKPGLQTAAVRRSPETIET